MTEISPPRSSRMVSTQCKGITIRGNRRCKNRVRHSQSLGYCHIHVRQAEVSLSPEEREAERLLIERDKQEEENRQRLRNIRNTFMNELSSKFCQMFSVNVDSKEKDCTICCCNENPEDKFIQLNCCKTIIHSKCMAESITSSMKCPYCRSECSKIISRYEQATELVKLVQKVDRLKKYITLTNSELFFNLTNKIDFEKYRLTLKLITNKQYTETVSSFNEEFENDKINFEKIVNPNFNPLKIKIQKELEKYCVSVK